MAVEPLARGEVSLTRLFPSVRLLEGVGVSLQFKLLYLAALGLILLGAGWAGLEMARRYIDDALNKTTGDIRTVAAVMVDTAQASLHHWLNLTLAAGGLLAVFGVLVSVLGGLRRSA